jgi:hypothetical protein
MDRYTKNDAAAAFNRLVEMIGGRVAEKYNDVGAYRLDHAGVYGGFVIERIVNDGGGVSRPFGDMRRPAREFCYTINFALRVLEQNGVKGQAA